MTGLDNITLERVRPQKKRTSSTELETLSLSWEMIQQMRLIRSFLWYRQETRMVWCHWSQEKKGNQQRRSDHLGHNAVEKRCKTEDKLNTTGDLTRGDPVELEKWKTWLEWRGEWGMKLEVVSFKKSYDVGKKWNLMLLLFGGSEVKVSACNVWDPGLIPGSGRSPGEGNGNSPQYSFLGNPMDGGAW